MPALRHVPIVVFTAKELVDEDRQRLTDQVKSVLQKGAYSHEQLVGQIRELLGHCAERGAEGGLRSGGEGRPK